MVLKVKAPALRTMIPWIESLIPARYKVKKRPWHKYNSLAEVSQSSGISESAIISVLKTSKSLHAIFWRGEFYIYPGAIVPLRKKFIRKIINKALRETF